MHPVSAIRHRVASRRRPVKVFILLTRRRCGARCGVHRVTDLADPSVIPGLPRDLTPTKARTGQKIPAFAGMTDRAPE